MTTNFPSGLDSFTNPTATDAMDSATVPHADQHADVNDAVEALQAKVGVDGSAVTSSLDYQLNALPAGIVTATSGGTSGAGYVLLTVDSSMDTTLSDVSGMTVTFTAVSGRLYRAHFDGLIEHNANVFINVDGSNVQRVQNSSGGFVSCAGDAIFTASGSIVVKLQQQATTGTVRIEAAAGRPANLVIEDIGQS